ncbi:hypothetical protein [Micromonospora sp. DT227]|uniref:hypothetical protein n=1 Tax=Micromonospora sp. DT227 TaxID=3393433 RepID=UPI003CF2C038
MSTVAWLAAVTAVVIPPPPALTRRADLHAPCAVPNPIPTPTSSTQSGGIQMPPGRPARPVLLDLARRLGADRCDATPGRFAVVRHHLWRYEASNTRQHDVVRWYADDDSGAELAIHSPNPQVAKDWWQPGGLRLQDLTKAYTSCERLISQAQMQSWGDDPAALIEGVAALGMWYSPNRQQRQLAARVLADTPGLTAHDTVADRAGRFGIGIAAFSDQGRSRHLLILDRATGQILAYEAAALTTNGWRAQMYLLLLTRTHAPRRWWEPPTQQQSTEPLQGPLYAHAGIWPVGDDTSCTTDRTTRWSAAR